MKDEDVAKMIEDAEKFALQDKETAENIKSRISLENYIETIKNDISNHNFQKNVGEDECKKLNEELEIICNWIDDDENINKTECDKRYNLLVHRMFPLLQLVNGKH